MSNTVPPTFEPDWKGLHHAATTFMYGKSYSDDDECLADKYDAVITEHNRQLAEAGMVVVRREDLEQAKHDLSDAANWRYRRADNEGCQRVHDLRDRLDKVLYPND